MGFQHSPREVWYYDGDDSSNDGFAESLYAVCSAVDGDDPYCSDSVCTLLSPCTSKADHIHYLGLPISNMC